MGVLNRVSIWIALRRHFSPVPRKVCIDFLCQIYRPIGLFSVGISSNGRISVGLWLNRPIVVFQYSTPPVSLKYKLRPLEKDTALSRHKKRMNCFSIWEKKHIFAVGLQFLKKCYKRTRPHECIREDHAAQSVVSRKTPMQSGLGRENSPGHIEGVYSTLCLRHTEILQPAVSKSRI